MALSRFIAGKAGRQARGGGLRTEQTDVRTEEQPASQPDSQKVTDQAGFFQLFLPSRVSLRPTHPSPATAHLSFFPPSPLTSILTSNDPSHCPSPPSSLHPRIHCSADPTFSLQHPLLASTCWTLAADHHCFSSNSVSFLLQTKLTHFSRFSSPSFLTPHGRQQAA